MLADELGIMEPFAVGLLEVFWHWVAKYRPSGDLTGVRPSLMARSIRYTGDAQGLWDAFLRCGFVDVKDDKYLVHDWSEHADNAVHQLLKKRQEHFADGCAPFARNVARASHKQFTNDSQTVCDSQSQSQSQSNTPQPPSGEGGKKLTRAQLKQAKQAAAASVGMNREATTMTHEQEREMQIGFWRLRRNKGSPEYEKQAPHWVKEILGRERASA